MPRFRWLHFVVSPQVITTRGELKFVSSDNQNIVFQPGQNGNVVLNGAVIKDASSLTGAKVSESD